MSLINEMLRDLEVRRAGELGKPDLQREIRLLPGRRSSTRGPLVASLILAPLAMAGVAAAWWWQAEPGLRKTAEPALAAVTVPFPPSVGAIGGAPEPVVEEALRLAESDSIVVDKLRPALAQVPVREASVPYRADRIRPPVAVPIESPAQKIGADQVPPVSSSNIEKTPVLGTPRERAEAEYRHAQALSAAGGAAPGAIEALLSALKQDPSYNPARQLLFKLFTESRRIDDAMGLLQEGIDQQPAQVGWAMSLARLQVERGDLAAGERTLARAAAYGAASAEFTGFHGYLLQRQGQFREAAENYLAATRVAPADGRWWFGLGQALEAGGRSEDARSAFRRALEAGNLNADLAALAQQKAR